MIINPKLYKIALLSIALVLMLVSTAGAASFGNIILKTDSSTGFVDFLKFPACGCDDHNYGCGDSKCDDKCKECPTCNCPTCTVPALQINKAGVLANLTNGHPINITYTYNITNTGNVPVSEINLYDNQTIPNGILVPGTTILNPGQSATTTSVYTGPFPTTDTSGTLHGNITNVAYATAIGNGIQVVSNKASVIIPYHYLG